MAEVVTPSRAVSAEWRRCPACEAFVYHKRLKRNLGVCPECNHHFRLRLSERLAQLCDEGSYQELGDDLEPIDVLGFADSKAYPDRIAEAQRKTGSRYGALYGTATIDGNPVVVTAIDFGFIGGSMGGAVGEAITRAAELALERRTPLLAISASGGARMQEGCVSLMQMAKTSQAVGRLNEEGVLFISLLTDPTYGGVSASYATLGDVLIAEPDAHIGFAGPSVIEQTIRQKLPDGFQTSGFLLDHGMLDLVVARESLRRTLGTILNLHARAAAAREDGGAGRLPETSGAAPVTDVGQLTRRDPWEIVQLARHIDRPRLLDLAGLIFDEFLELHGDRAFEEDAAIVSGLGRIGELTVVVIGHQKGHTTNEMLERNFGMPNPEGYRKGMRLMRYAARFGMPVVTFVDTPGAYPGLGAEERGQSNAIAESIALMSRLPVPLVTAVTGEGGSGGALALAAADHVVMLENAYYSVISPEGCATILFKDAAAALEGLLPLAPEDLLARRYERFRMFGTPGRQPVLQPIEESG